MPDATLTAAAPAEWFGWHAGVAGDLNGDGFADLYVSAPYDNGIHGLWAGYVRVYLGGSAAPFDETEDATLVSGASYSLFGYAAGGIGDVTGDGYDDLAVGAPTFGNVGMAYVFHGGAGTGFDAGPDWYLPGGEPNGYWASAVAAATSTATATRTRGGPVNTSTARPAWMPGASGSTWASRRASLRGRPSTSSARRRSTISERSWPGRRPARCARRPAGQPAAPPSSRYSRA